MVFDTDRGADGEPGCAVAPRGAATHKAPVEPRVLGEIGSQLVFENERVRIWVLRLAPGERSATHRHDLPHVLVQIAGDRIAVAPEPDSLGPFRDYLEADVVAGMATYVDAGGIETAHNVGAEPYREVIVELKDPPPA